MPLPAAMLYAGAGTFMWGVVGRTIPSPLLPVTIMSSVHRPQPELEPRVQSPGEGSHVNHWRSGLYGGYNGCH